MNPTGWPCRLRQPSAHVGDINGDGLDDFYIGGAKDQAGAVFLVRPGGEPRRLGPAEGVDTRAVGLGSGPDGAPIVQLTSGFRVWDGARFAPTEPRDEVLCWSFRTHATQPACPPRNDPAGPWRISGDAITHAGREVWPLPSAAASRLWLRSTTAIARGWSGSSSSAWTAACKAASIQRT